MTDTKPQPDPEIEKRFQQAIGKALRTPARDVPPPGIGKSKVASPKKDKAAPKR